MPRLPNGWSLATLEEVCEVIPGQSPPGSSYNTRGDGLPFFQGKAEFGELYPKAVKWTTKPTKVAQKDDILISIRAPVGPTNLCPGDACIGRGLAALRPRRGVLARYVLYALRDNVQSLVEQATGSTFQAVSARQLRKHKIPLAPSSEQQRIVDEIEKQLTRLETGSTSLLQAAGKLRQQRASILSFASQGRLVPNEAILAESESRFFESGIILLRRILDERRNAWPKKGRYHEPAEPRISDGFRLPQEWAWSTLEQLNVASRPIAYGVLQPGEHIETGVPLVRVGDIENGKINISGLKRISPAIAARYPRTKLQGGELVITLVGAIGRTAIVPASLSGGNTARAVGVIPLTKDVRSKWVEFWFRSPEKNAEMVSKAHEVARKTLNLEDVRVTTVALPPLLNRSESWQKSSDD